MTDRDKLSKCRMAFESWRNSRIKRQRVPDQLWQMAVGLLQQYGITHVAKELNLNAQQLRKKQLAFKQQKLPKNETQEKSLFVELSQFLPTTSASSEAKSSVVELQIQRTDGTRLTLSLNSSQTDMIQNLVTAFVRV